MKYTVTPNHIDFKVIQTILQKDTVLEIGAEAVARIKACRDYLDKKTAGNKHPYYGINTGFGSLYNKSISEDDLEQLQANLIMSHACGMGDEVPDELVRLMLFLKIQGLSHGYSGVQVLTVQRLADFFNLGIHPVVYQQGSLGASGDLAPLAHLCLPLLGLGEMRLKGQKMPAAEALKQFNLEPIHLHSKEGLALLNGTQFMSTYGTWAVLQANRLERISDIVGAISLEGFHGRIEPFHHLIQEVRPHAGQIKTAIRYRELLKGSEIISTRKTHVQDPYSFRCIPQVHGASKDAINYVTGVVFTEINAVTDNPTVFPEVDLIISAGNFHGQPLALALDFMAIALAELGNISERRTYQLISGLRELPAFLIANPGLDSGFMIPQYTAASIVSQNKQLCTPASVDSIVSSNGQEDHVSMGSNAATKLYRVAENLERILAIELMNAAQAIEFRRPAKSSVVLDKVVEAYRKEVSFVTRDRVMYEDLNRSVEFLRNYNFETLID